MKFLDFLTSPLFEGVQAIKGSSKITQKEVLEVAPELLSQICHALDLPKSKVKLIGSAGKKPDPEDLSGDLDVAVECSREQAEKVISELGKGNSKPMKGIGVYSFAYEVGNKFVQVDLMPVNNIKYAEWSYQANIEDLKLGLKGAHRNELMFATAKYMPQEILDKEQNGDIIATKRYFYDLAKGLMQGIKTRKTKKGKVGKNFSTIDKSVVTDNPNEVAAKMFGKGVTAEQVSTFAGVLAAIRSADFPQHDQVAKILDLAKQGIKGKGLKIPSDL